MYMWLWAKHSLKHKLFTKNTAKQKLRLRLKLDRQTDIMINHFYRYSSDYETVQMGLETFIA